MRSELRFLRLMFVLVLFLCADSCSILHGRSFPWRGWSYLTLLLMDLALLADPQDCQAFSFDLLVQADCQTRRPCRWDSS